MFDVIWIPVNTNNLTADLGPGQCGLDIVGDSIYPGVYAVFDSSYVYFRLRLNCDPRKNNPPDILAEKIWGVLIKDVTGPLYTIRVNGKNNSQQVEVYTATSSDPFYTIQCSSPIVYGDSGNAQINPAGTTFDSTDDYFLDFRASISCFPPNFFKNALAYCGLTSDDAQNINKEIPPPYPKNNPDLCGGIMLLPEEVPPRGINFINATIISL